MPDKLTYSDHIEHYRMDAEVADYFAPNKNEAQAIRRRYQHFKSLLNPKDNQFVLEIGSGGGEATNILKDKTLFYIPTDLSLKNLKQIKYKAAGITRPVMADAFNLPYHDNTVDLLIMSEVLEHLHDPQRALSELQRVLKKGGKAVISVPYKEKISYQLCIHCNRLTPTHAHLHSFDEDKLVGWIEKAGLAKNKIMKVNNKLAALIQLPRLLKFVPFSIYKIIDAVLNILIPKMSHLVIVVIKIN